MTLACKIYPNENAARGALNALEAQWTPPPMEDIGLGPHADHSVVGEQHIAQPSELDDGRWVLYGDHPAMKGDIVTVGELKRNVRAARHIQGDPDAGLASAKPKDKAIEVEPVGAESGVVERPGAKKARTA